MEKIQKVQARTKTKMGDIGNVFYTLACIFSWGAIWILKLTIQKAVHDAMKWEEE